MITVRGEVWRPVVGYGGRYEVSDLGRVLSHFGKAPRILRPGRRPAGHLTVCLGRSHTRTVHTLVMGAFVGPPPPGQEVRHLNGDPTDNRLVNLAYGTRSQNIRDKKWHGRPRVLTVERVREIKARLASGCALRGIAREFGVGATTIWNIKTGRTHVDVTP